MIGGHTFRRSYASGITAHLPHAQPKPKPQPRRRLSSSFWMLLLWWRIPAPLPQIIRALSSSIAASVAHFASLTFAILTIAATSAHHIAMCLIESYLQMANIDANLKPMPALDTTTTTTAAAAAAPKASNGSVDAKIIASSSPKDDNNNNNNNGNGKKETHHIAARLTGSKFEPETTTAEAPAAAAAAPVSHTLEENFRSFAKFGDIKSSGDTITLSNSDKWFKQAKIIDGKKITTTDTGIYWKAVAKTKKTLSLTEYNAFLETLAKMKKLEIDELKDKLKATGPPATNKTTSTGTSGAFGRLTDHTRYTGSHKQRFDEAGKGRGKAGRVDTVVNTGYVTGFKA